MTSRRHPKVFVSYSSETEPHKRWVHDLGSKLREQGIDVIDYQDAVSPGESWGKFMEGGVFSADFVVAVLTPEFKRKTDHREGGVGYEQQLVSAMIAQGIPRSRFIPILRSGAEKGATNAIPLLFQGIRYIDFRNDSAFETSFGALVSAIKDRPQISPGADVGPETADNQRYPTVAAFVGATLRGPVYPVMVHSLNEFVDVFGEQNTWSFSSFMAPCIRGYFEAGGQAAYVCRVVGRDAEFASVQLASVTGTCWLELRARDIGAWGNQISVQVLAGTRTGFRLVLTYKPESADAATISEDYDNLGVGPDQPNPVEAVLGARSALVVGFLVGDEPPHYGVEDALSGGTDGGFSVDDYDRSGDVEISSGLNTLPDDTDLVCIPDHVSPYLSPSEREAVTMMLIADCERHRRFALLSVENDFDIETANASLDTSFAAVFAPWLSVCVAENSQRIDIPAVGHVAGALAAHDRRAGLFSKPVGLRLLGPSSKDQVTLTEPLDGAGADQLAKKGVNAIGYGPDGAPQILSAVTMAIDYDDINIETMRLMRFIERQIRQGLTWLLFEPISQENQTRAKEEVEEFLNVIWREGGLVGDTAEEAYYVRVGTDIMTADDIDNGRFLMDIGLAPHNSPMRLLKVCISPQAESGETIVSSIEAASS